MGLLEYKDVRTRQPNENSAQNANMFDGQDGYDEYRVMQIRTDKLHSYRLVALGLAVAMTAGCASKPLNVAYNPENFGPPDPVQVAKVPDEIGAGDKIRVTIFQVDSLSGEFQVEGNGQIDFPLIGVVQAQGHTPAEFAKILADRLGKSNLRNPNVQVAVIERAGQAITIEGAVNQAGVVPIRGQTTLLQAIAMARGTSEDANASQVVVFRRIDGQRMAAAFDLRAIRRAEAEDPVIYANDIVVVAGSQNRKLIQSVLQAVPVIGLFRPFL